MKTTNFELKIWPRASWNRPDGSLVATNGCFDLLHAGHVRYLYEASKLAPTLVVGLNSDVSVAALKGPGRPLRPQYERALLLAALEFVDFVVIFDEVRADLFLRAARPTVYVKGGDYSLATLDPGERRVLEECGASIRFIPSVAGISTTSLIEKIQRVCRPFADVHGVKGG